MGRADWLLISISFTLISACFCVLAPMRAQSINGLKDPSNAGGASWHHLRLDDGFLKRSKSSAAHHAEKTEIKTTAKPAGDVADNKSSKTSVAIAADPIAQAQASLKANKIDEAINILTAAIKSNPSDYHLLELRAHCYVEIRQTYQALADLTHAIEVKPSDVVLHRNRAYVHFMLHDFAHCLEDLDVVSKNGTFTAGDYFLKANCYSSLGEPKLVVENATAGLKLAPTNVEGYFTRAKAYLKLNQRELGNADFDKAVALEKKH